MRRRRGSVRPEAKGEGASASSPASAVASSPAVGSLRHPANVIAVAFAALCILISASFVISDSDLWQHLLVGKAIWQLHAFPTRQLWTWPTYGAPDVNASWGFRAVIWPLWDWAGAWGLSLWRWLTTLAAFGLMWATARLMGARGLSPLVVMVLCSLSYRQRAQIRPETLVAVLMALEVWILERRRRVTPPRAGRPRFDLALCIIPLVWVWVNAHISYLFGFAILAFHGIDSLIASRHTAPAGKRTRPGGRSCRPPCHGESRPAPVSRSCPVRRSRRSSRRLHPRSRDWAGLSQAARLRWR